MTGDMTNALQDAPLLQNPEAVLFARLQTLPAGSRTIIGMGGFPGSGKSTLAAQLTRAVNARAGADAMVSLGMDGFHLPQSALRQMPDPETAFARRGALWTFNPRKLLTNLRLLRDQAGYEPVMWPGFEHAARDPVENTHVVPSAARLVLVEGIYLLHRGGEGWDEISRFFDERWYLDTPLETAMTRLIARHRAAWNLTKKQATLRANNNDRVNAQIVERSRAFADWRVLPGEKPQITVEG